MLAASPRRAKVSWEMCALEAAGFLVSHNGSNFTWVCLKKHIYLQFLLYCGAENHSGNISLCHTAELFYGFYHISVLKLLLEKTFCSSWLPSISKSLVYKGKPTAFMAGSWATFTQCR